MRACLTARLVVAVLFGTISKATCKHCDCTWTSKFACPAALKPGSEGCAVLDESACLRVCCPEPPSPPPEETCELSLAVPAIAGGFRLLAGPFSSDRRENLGGALTVRLAGKGLRNSTLPEVSTCADPQRALQSASKVQISTQSLRASNPMQHISVVVLENIWLALWTTWLPLHDDGSVAGCAQWELGANVTSFFYTDWIWFQRPKWQSLRLSVESGYVLLRLPQTSVVQPGIKWAPWPMNLDPEISLSVLALEEAAISHGGRSRIDAGSRIDGGSRTDRRSAASGRTRDSSLVAGESQATKPAGGVAGKVAREATAGLAGAGEAGGGLVGVEGGGVSGGFVGDEERGPLSASLLRLSVTSVSIYNLSRSFLSASARLRLQVGWLGVENSSQASCEVQISMAEMATSAGEMAQIVISEREVGGAPGAARSYAYEGSAASDQSEGATVFGSGVGNPANETASAAKRGASMLDPSRGGGGGRLHPHTVRGGNALCVLPLAASGEFARVALLRDESSFVGAVLAEQLTSARRQQQQLMRLQLGGDGDARRLAQGGGERVRTSRAQTEGEQMVALVLLNFSEEGEESVAGRRGAQRTENVWAASVWLLCALMLVLALLFSRGLHCRRCFACVHRRALGAAAPLPAEAAPQLSASSPASTPPAAAAARGPSQPGSRTFLV